jgi:hypothetical protein
VSVGQSIAQEYRLSWDKEQISPVFSLFGV